jgi:ketosteroid isomerase-like protein
MMDAADQLAIRRLADLYGYLVDNRAFSRIGEVFTDDVVYEVSDFGDGVRRGIPEVVAGWRTARHPLAHHAVNVLIDEQPDGTAAVITLALGVGEKGRVGSVTHDDTAVRTPAGWRLSHRRAVLRRPESIPTES